MKQPRGDLGKCSSKMAGNLKYTLKHHWPIRIHTNLINQSHVEAKKGSLFQAREVDTSLVWVETFMEICVRKIS